MQRKWTYTKNVQSYGNSYVQCFPYKITLHGENVCFSEDGYFKISRVRNELQTLCIIRV